MAQAPMFRINQLAKDFDIKSKDLITALEEEGITGKKSMANLEPEEFNLFLDTLTKENQIADIEGYLHGKTRIPSVRMSKAAQAAAEKRKAEEEAAKRAAEEAKKEAEARAAAEQAEREKAEAIAREKAKDAALLKAAAAARARAEEEAAQKARREAVAAQKQQAVAQAKAAPATKPQQPKQRQEASAPKSNPNQKRGAQNVSQKIQQTLQQRQEAAAMGQSRDFTPDQTTMSKQKAKQSAPANERKRTGTTRVVDTRSVSVNLSKYDERLEKFAPETNRDQLAAGKQKLKKQNTRDVRSAKNRNKESAAMEKLRRKAAMEAKKQPLKITVPDEISVGELASRLKVTAAEVVKRLMLMGSIVTVNQIIDFDTAFLVAEELGAQVTKEVVVTIEEKLFSEEEDDSGDLVERAPVVCVMGHVDHGKTSLLDAIRHTSVTSGEAGGITQHIGAYRVSAGGKEITFLDTPGHEAFTAMRARGAQATDIAILVVAADDGIMPQTVESINHAKAAKIPIIVAINKMDKPEANPERIKQQLTEYELVAEDWGGETIICPISAKTGMGIDNLLEMVTLTAEVAELKANPRRAAQGTVVEARLDKGRGPVATLLVQNGTLHSGDIIIAGTAVGRVRAMLDDKGNRITEAGPSVPVEITGLGEVPGAGSPFNAVADERLARELVEQRKAEERAKANAPVQKVSLEDLFSQIQSGEVKDLNIIVKADVQGSAEAVKASLEKISNEEVRVRVIHSGVGAISESDVMLAATSKAIIVGFNVRPDPAARDSAARSNVDMRMYRVIYDAIGEVEAAMKGMLAPKFREALIGHAEVRQTYKVSGVGTIAGCYVQDGKIQRSCQVRIVRDGIVIHEGMLASLQRFKDAVKEVASGYECGMSIEKFNDIKEGDIIECFVMEQIEV